MSARQSFILKTALIVVLVFGFVILITLPAHSFFHHPGDTPTDGFSGFYGTEKNNQNLQFTWATPQVKLEYPLVPRYTPLNLRLRIGLQRPPNAPPARLEISERATDPVSETGPLTVLQAQPGNNDVQDYYVTIPARPSGKGLALEINTNSFQVAGDRRELGFIFVESELSLPRTHLLKLFWPNPFWVAGLVVVGALAAWCLLAGLTVFEALLMAAMAAFVLASFMASAYQYSWWMLLLAVGFAALFVVDLRWGRQEKRSFWIIVAASAVLVGVFLFTPDTHYYDIQFYKDWGASVHNNGLWNIYHNTPTLDYTPLIVYLLGLYNLVVYPLGLQDNDMAWRILSSLLFLLLVGMVYLVKRAAAQPSPKDQEQGSTNPVPARWLVIVAFNVAIFYNSAVWGQADILPTLALVTSFFFILRRQVLTGGVALGLTAISKPQAWFILPLLLWIFVQRIGWKKALPGLGLAGLVAVGLGGFAFGFDPNSIITYLTRSELGGEYVNNIPTAFNFSYLLLGQQRTELPTWLSLFGFGVVGLVLLALVFTTGKNRSIRQYGLGATLLNTACFTFLIKMKERYLLYGLPFMALAAWKESRLLKAFLWLSWLQLLHLVTNLYYAGPWGRRGLLNSFYAWSYFLSQEWLQRIISVGTLATFAYLAFLYWQQFQADRRKISGVNEIPVISKSSF